LYLVASSKGLHGIHWHIQNASTKELPTDINNLFAKAELQIEEYLTSTRRDFNLPLYLEGTTFQKKVWYEINKIKYGKTCSYLDIAIAVGNKKACRAVGAATGKNPLSLIIPCHRIISTTGTLTGYAGTLPRKKKLLELEKNNYENR
jgi:methylated-DNA-[protein]-cysteine S-methyltransferase